MNVFDGLEGADRQLAAAAALEALAGEHRPADRWITFAGRLLGGGPLGVPAASARSHVETMQAPARSVAIVDNVDNTYNTIDVSFPEGMRPVFNVDADGHLVVDKSQAVLQVRATSMVIGWVEDDGDEADGVLYADGATVDAVNAEGNYEEASWKRAEWYGNAPLSIRKFLNSLGVDEVQNTTSMKLG